MLALKYTGAKEKQLEKPKIVHVISPKPSARMVNTSKVNGQGNTVRKPEATLYYNTNMGGVDRMYQQLHGIQVLQNTCKWFHLIMLLLLSSHKLYKSRGGKIGFLQFIHDIVCQMVAHAPILNPRPPKDNVLQLTERYFPAQIPYSGQAAKKTYSYKKCQVCNAMGVRTPSGHPIKAVWCCPDCPDQPGL